MTPEEHTLLTGLFDRLRQTDRGDYDPEAAQVIRDALNAHPGAPYLMAQLLLVQDQALSAAQQHITALEQERSRARSATRVPASGRSFLAGATAGGPGGGPWTRPAASASPVPQPAIPQPAAAPAAGYGPYGGAPTAAASGGNSFLRGALQTAAGVAGGALLFQGISSLLHAGSGPWGSGFGGVTSGGFLPEGVAPTVINETIVNEPNPGINALNSGQTTPDTANDPQPPDWQNADDTPFEDGSDWSDGGDGDLV